MGKLKKNLNDELLNALSEEKDVFSGLYSVQALDDEQLALVNKAQQLPQLYKDVLYLCSQMSVVEVARLYCVSRQYIYKILKEAKGLLNG